MKRIVPPRTNDPAELEKFFVRICQILNSLATVTSTATTLDGLKADFNTLLTKLRGE